MRRRRVGLASGMGVLDMETGEEVSRRYIPYFAPSLLCPIVLTLQYKVREQVEGSTPILYLDMRGPGLLVHQVDWYSVFVCCCTDLTT